MRLIDADLLYEDVALSLLDNPHKPGMIRVNHTNEHQHFLNLILKADTVDAERVVHARWRFGISDPDPFDESAKAYYYCSECGSKAHSYTYDDGLAECTFLSDYCPYCGAKMDLKAEGTDE